MPFEVLDDHRWLEIRLVGSVTANDGVSARELVPTLLRGRGLLLDFSDVIEVRASVESMVALMKVVGPAAIRCAILATRPAIFGINRQAVLLAGLDDARRLQVFMDRPLAMAWLSTTA